jgi:hypothetical protein
VLIKKISVLLAVFLLLCGLSGCSVQLPGTDSLLRPPNPSSEEQSIQQAIFDKLGKQPLLCYPKRGEHRAAITMHDIDADGIDEAVVFFREVADSPNITLAVLSKANGRWSVAGTVIGEGNDVDRVDFCRINASQAGNQIVVGWNVGTGNKILSIYDFLSGVLSPINIDDSLTEKDRVSLSNYTEYSLVDIEGDGNAEICTVILNPAEIQAYCSILKLYTEETGTSFFQKSGGCELNSGVTRYAQICSGYISVGRSAVFLDGYLSSDVMITEIITLDKNTGNVYTPLNQPANGVYVSTERSSLILCRDINSDDIVEIPFSETLPGYEDTSSRVTSLTAWHVFDSTAGEISKEASVSTILNEPDGYMFILPNEWRGKVTVKYDQKTKIMYFHEVSANSDGKNVFGDELFRIAVFDSKNSTLLSSSGYMILSENRNFVYTAFITKKNPSLDITPSRLKLCFAEM